MPILLKKKFNCVDAFWFFCNFTAKNLVTMGILF